MLDAKLLKPLSRVQTTTALRAVNIIGTFEKRAPDYETNETYATESTEHKNWTKLKHMLADAVTKHVFLEV